MNTLGTDVVLACDTSLYDFFLDAPILKDAGVETVVVKLGSGDQIDPKFYKNAEAAAKGGLNLQIYYWDDIILDPLHQVDWATNEIKKSGLPVTFVWVDVEQWWTDWTLWLQARQNKIPYSDVPRAIPENISSQYAAFMDGLNKNIPAKVGAYTNWGFISSWARPIQNWIGKYNLWNPLYANQPTLGYACEWKELKEKWLPKEWPATCPGETPENVVGYQWTGDAFRLPGVTDELGRNVLLDVDLFKKSFMQTIKDPITFPGVPVPVFPPPTPTPVSVVGKYAVNVHALNIRKGPGTKFDLAGDPIPVNTVVDVLEANDKGDWVRIATGLLTSAWCYFPYLTTTLPVVTPIVPVKYKVAVWAVNIRKGPGTNYALAGLPKIIGTVVNVVKVDGDWALLDSGAYCFAPYLTRLP